MSLQIHTTYAGNGNRTREVLVYVVMDGDQPRFASLDKAECERYTSFCHECGYDYNDPLEGCDTCAPLKK